MKIAVVGSYASIGNRKWPGRGTLAEFQEACREIGGHIARGGHRLVVQFDKDEYADPHAVRGYDDVMRQVGRRPTHGITVAKPDASHHTPFVDQADLSPGLVSTRGYRARKWDSVRYRACSECDATILIGGSEGTESTGYVILAAGKTLVPIAAFGGAASQLVDDATSARPPFTNSQAPLGRETLELSWSGVLSSALGAWLEQEEPDPAMVIVHGRDVTSRDALVRILTVELGLIPPRVMQLERIPGATLPEKWESVAAQAKGAIVVATPDDEGRLRGAEELALRARQNVWLELGWFWGRFVDRGRLLVLIKKERGRPIELASDYLGVEFYEYEKDPVEQLETIRSFVAHLRSN
jgi:CAP12/Pycsar effector protein, TIR domain